MKTKLSPFYLLSFVFYLLSFVFLPSALCQVPQGFNYQAVIRDGVSGNPIIGDDVQIRFTIQTSTPVVVYQETHAVVTDQFGVVSIVIGNGTPVGGFVFSEIDWSTNALYLRTEIEYPATGTPDYDKLMGTAQIMSVPYSLVANDVAGPIEKLGITGTTEEMDEALFEVKNKDGQTVFAVYNEGIRAYVNDIDAKGVKGGFAIGGFGMDKTIPHEYLFISGDSVRFYIDNGDTDKGPKGGFAIGGFGTVKGLNQKYLMVSNDSVRIYVDNTDSDKGVKGGFAIGGYGTAKGNPQKLLTVSNDSVRIYINDAAKGPKGGFAIGGFDQAKGDGNNTNFFNVSTSAEDTIDPSQNRILWYPVKNAFLTGKVLIELPDSVGENSFASGFESKALGDYSQALGYQAIARENYSTAIGYQAVANKINSFAFGQWATAKNEESYAFGRGAIAEGFRSYAFGSAGIDSAGSVTGVAYAKGDYSLAIGQGSIAYGFGSGTLGLADTALGDYSIAIGYRTNAQGYGSTTMGRETTASGNYSTAVGYKTTAFGVNSIAMGGFTSASGDNSTAMGYLTEAPADNSTAIGLYTNALAWASIAMGVNTTASGQASTAMGFYSTASGFYSTAAGGYSTASGNYSTAMGNETIASGHNSTTTGNETTASGNSSTAMGSETIASGSRSTAMGRSTTASGDYSSALGYLTVAPSACETVIGLWNTLYTPAGGATGMNYSDRLFVLGNGTISTRSNAMTVLKNGRIGLQTVVAPTYALELPNSATQGVGKALAYAWDTYSDARLKTDRRLLPYGLEEVLMLNPLLYLHHGSIVDETGLSIKDSGVYEVGLIAQEVYDVIPEAVNKPENEESELWSMSYDKLVPVLVNAIKEQQAQIEAMKVEIEELKKR